ncbi:hypothetical protein QAD02_020673 [Eretmocerus hayati]|uniref:Uncharacterized protein n=1 Tax=Eretmocerus hayati TaxID=131215 RepID=A0ACC2PMQ2_9HYME|nr:hypothetical protein QAD02_020673 [Eretmocerus hayati]
MQTIPVEIERVREQTNQSAAVPPPLSTPPPSATTGRQDERGPPRSPTPPPPSSATRDTGEPVRFLRRPHELPPVRDSGAEGTTTLPRPFPVLPQVRRLEAPAAEQSGVEVVAASAPDQPPATVAPPTPYHLQRYCESLVTRNDHVFVANALSYECIERSLRKQVRYLW